MIEKPSNFREYLQQIRQMAEGPFEELQEEVENTNAFNNAFFELVQESGIYRCAIPEEYGGWGMSDLELMQIQEEDSRGPGGTPQYFHEKSHGESFLQLAQNSFRDGGMYLMDEPEAALSPQRQLTMLLEIVRGAQNGSQFIMATHSPILLGIPDAEILCFDGGEIHPVSYEDTDSYRVTEMFINDRRRLLERLLSEEE